MIPALQLLGFWAVAFLTLGVAIVLLNIFESVIGNDLTLLSLRKEAVIAAVASLIEAASVWAWLTFLPAAGRALIIPGLVVAMIYKAAHLEDWTFKDILMLLVFQALLGVSIGLMLSGHFGGGMLILVVSAGLFVVVAAVLKDL